MNSINNITVVVIWIIVLSVSPAFAFSSGLSGFSDAFIHDYASAEEMVNQTKSVEPLIKLQSHYTNLAEQAELEVSIGIIYGQRTGLVNPSNAVIHFTKALQYALPEKTYIQILMWRGNSQEQLIKLDDALVDYLRDLLACSYYDLTEGWPKILPSKIPIYMNSPDSENRQRVRDYNLYRSHLDFQQFLLMQRCYLIDAVKRVRGEKGVDTIMAILQTLTPDSSKYGIIMNWLKSENKRPWP